MKRMRIDIKKKKESSLIYSSELYLGLVNPLPSISRDNTSENDRWVENMALRISSLIFPFFLPLSIVPKEYP